jgi:ABC-type transporter Mla maintaining outer membrane lipid asymmetry ATPase subunit MlaF
MEHTATGQSRPRGPATAAPAVVVFDRVSFAFDEHVVLQNISFSIPKGAMRILLGASGAGKSVVLKLILGLLRADSGTILVNGQRVSCACAPISACCSRRAPCSIR